MSLLAQARAWGGLTGLAAAGGIYLAAQVKEGRGEGRAGRLHGAAPPPHAPSHLSSASCGPR